MLFTATVTALADIAFFSDLIGQRRFSYTPTANEFSNCLVIQFRFSWSKDAYPDK